jgi:SAM-dependent methyltransferase
MDVNCPICDGTESWPTAGTLDPDVAVWRTQAGVTQPYSWQLCKTCGNGYPSERPLPVVLDQIWQANRRVDGDPATVEAVWQRRLAMSRVSAERSYGVFAPLHCGPPGRFLDIACGLGETVAQFGDRGWRTEGIDLDASTKRFHEMRELPIRIGRFEDESLWNRFDMIHIAHAIYFITEPMSFLRRVRAHLTDGGIFAVVISDFLAAHASGGPNYAHTFYPCRDSMRYALALAGLYCIFTRTIGGDIYIAAKPAAVKPASINTARICWKYRTKNVRFAVMGRPYLAARHLAKRIISR